ncbi:MAG: TIGR03915 family putative DNA repair protein [Lachnospiraceae bacterium]|nr:TIGR03915 family putative DNA repair protein [Lachnospiraceae bacterium]MDD5853617.1 TIGR03915 family putative DNA repair protein [Lachnospiraceae bacterium]
MYIFTCEHKWDAMLTCIYDAWASKKGHANIKLMLEPVEQYSLFDTYTHVDADEKKAESVMRSVKNKISFQLYRQLAYASMAYEKDILDLMYRVLIVGFSCGPDVLNMVMYREILQFNQIYKRLCKEVNHFQEFTRFHEVQKGVFVAHIEPKSQLVVALGPIFADRMPSEHFMIVDDVHREALIHPRNEMYYLKTLSDEEYEQLLHTEEINDSYTDLWKLFFHTIAIKERANAKCQDNLFPLWTRKHAVEFME